MSQVNFFVLRSISIIKFFFCFLKEQINKSQTVRTNNLRERVHHNINSLVLCICLLNVFGTLPRNIVYIFRLYMETSLVLDYLYGVTVVIYFMTHACSLFVYYSFNKLFKNVLLSHLKKRRLWVSIFEEKWMRKNVSRSCFNIAVSKQRHFRILVPKIKHNLVTNILKLIPANSML